MLLCVCDLNVPACVKRLTYAVGTFTRWRSDITGERESGGMGGEYRGRTVKPFAFHACVGVW